MLPKFSVLMSLYNGEKPECLNECLVSLSKQKLKATEVVLIIDGPINPILRGIVDLWTEKLNLKIFPLPKNLGLTNALNIGLIKCDYELVARMDTDDICMTDRFSKQCSYMENNPTIDICGTFAQDISENGVPLDIRIKPVLHIDIKKYVWTNPLIHPSVMFKKSKIIKIGSYNVKAPNRHDDYELWIRAAQHGLLFANIPEVLIHYRVPNNPYQKTSLLDRISTFKLGYKVIWSYDRRLIAFLGLTYPIIRSILPLSFRKPLSKFVKKFSPR